MDIHAVLRKYLGKEIKMIKLKKIFIATALVGVIMLPLSSANAWWGPWGGGPWGGGYGGYPGAYGAPYGAPPMMAPQAPATENK